MSLQILIALVFRFCDAPMAVPPVTTWEMAYEPGAVGWLN